MRAALVVLLTVLSLLASTALAGATTTLHATLSGKKEVPKAGNGTGTARLTLDAKKGRVCFRIRLQHVGTVVMGHIHKGGKSVAGPIAIPLFGSPTRQPKGCTRASKATIRAIIRKPGKYYVNVHTAKFPAGAARGQLH
jgi:CHRD domain-containing protein